MKNILVVDDSALMRRVISDIIEPDENLATAYFASNGYEALEILDSHSDVDVIVLDINMPKMNGIEFLEELQHRGRKEKVLIVSTLAKEGGVETIRALELGAYDFVTKPEKLSEAKGPSFQRKILWMLYIGLGLSTQGIGEEHELEHLQMVKARESTPSNDRVTHANMASASHTNLVKSFKGDRSKHSSKIISKDASKIVALCCSTGGPKALQKVIPYLPANLDAAVVLVQHMPEGFTASLAKRLNELSQIHVKEAEHEESMQKGTVYIAKGGSQMRVIEKEKGNFFLSVKKEPARNSLKPCADIMYESLMGSSFDDITCVVLTGMGCDGTQGILELEDTNKIYVIAQNEETSTVYGMPKSIVHAGVADEEVALEEVAISIINHVGVQ